MANKMLCFKLVICGIMIAFTFQDIHAQSSLDCNFNDGFCEWKQDESDGIDWERQRHFSEDYSMYVGGFGIGQKARLISSTQRPGQTCMTFIYVMNEVYQDALKVFLSYTGESEKHVLISAVTASNRWTPAVISLNTSSEYKVVIEGKRVIHFLHYDTVWLDDIVMAHGFCTDCNFDTDFCNWKNNITNNFNWTLQNLQEGTTGYQNTGSGKYAHIGSTEMNNGGMAKLIGPKQSAGKYCISFLYYMLGEQDGGLKVLVEDEQQTSQEIKDITGSNGQKWIHYIDTFQSAESFKIAFEGRLSSGNGEIAIDDVMLLSCQDCVDPSPKHGHANATSFQYGSKVEITCDTGYNLTGSPFTECQANGVWSNILICVLIDCGHRTIINGGFSADDETTFGSTATQICNTGYRLVGDEIVNCTSSGWSSPETACITVECGQPVLENGHSNATKFYYGSNVEITCDTGYNLTGSPLIQCQANGAWSNDTKCDPFDCENRTIINGVFIANDGTTFKSTATQICDTGYSLVGNAKVSCTALGWSSPETRCIIAEEGKSALTAIYVVAPVIIVASSIAITIVFLRKRPKCMNVMSSTNKSKTTHNMPYFNETYNGETSQGQIYANMSDANEPIQSTEEYAIITDCSKNSVKNSNKETYKNDDKDTYDHTNNASKSFEDTTYSHISGNRSNQTDESSYNSTVDLKSKYLTRFADSTNEENCYNVSNKTDNIKAANSQAKTLIEEPDYDHANAGGPDPTSGDFDDYSHINRREGNDGNTAGI